MTELTRKQALFVKEYLVDLNATQAAIRAGYSPKTAKQQGARLLTNANVQAAVAAGMEARSERTEITADRVMQELAKIGFADIRKAVKWGSRLVERPEETLPPGESMEAQPHGGALKRRKASDDGSDAFYVTSIEMLSSEELDDETALAVAEVVQTKEGVRIKFHDKVQALTQMGRHLGMFTDKNELVGPGGGPLEANIKVEFVKPAGAAGRE